MYQWIRLSVVFLILTATWLPMVANSALAATGCADCGGTSSARVTEEERTAFCPGDPASPLSGEDPGFAGKPVNLLSGAETYVQTDLTIGSLFPITVIRRYDSRSTYDSSVGFGWAVNYDRRIYTYPDGSVTLRKECGWKRRFTLSGGNYIGPIGETGTLVQNADGSFTYTYKTGEKDNYDARGRLISRIDTKGNSLALYYELDSRSPLWGILPTNISQSTALIVAYDYRLSRIEERNSSGSMTNNYVLFHYDSTTGRLTDIVDSSGRTVIYSHDGIGNLTGMTGPAGNSIYGYTDPVGNHRMTSVDQGQGSYNNTYDETGRVKVQSHGTGEVDMAYLVPNQKTQVTTVIRDGSGNTLNTQVRTTEFDSLGQPAKVTDTYGNITTYSRDGNGWILAEVHTDIVTGITTTTAYAYDAKGNVLTKTEAQGTSVEKTTAYTYQPVFNGVLMMTVVSVVNPALVSTVTNSYDDSNGNLLTTTEAGLLGNGSAYSYTTTYSYDANGKLHTIDGPRTDVSDVTTYNYDPSTGYLTSMTQPLIGTTFYSNFDNLGNPQTVTDPNGNSTTYTYDTNGRVSTVKAPGDANPTQYFYVSGGKIDHITLPEGNTINYHYDDGMGNLTSISDSQGNSINYTYDSAGNKLTEQIKDSSGALQKSLSYSYDALNRLSTIANPDGSHTGYGYDGRGNRTSLRTPNGPTTTYTYDALNRLATVTQPPVAPAASIVTIYGYNSNNNLTTVKDANTNTTTYTYDDKGRVYQVISPDTGTTTYGYDPAGNLTAKTDAKGTAISYAYDALNRLTRINFPSDTSIVYTYDTCPNGKGRLCRMDDASGTTTYEYSPKGQVAKETRTIGGVNYVSQYTYDQDGNIKTMAYPSGKVITYNYTNDRAVSVLNGAANLAANIAYKPFGGMSGLTYGNGLPGSISYDNQYRVSGITAGTVLSLSYPTYDNNGNIQAIQNQLDPTKNKSFSYDALDRLGTATASGIWGSLGWTYDGVGNRLTENGNAYTYTANTNKLANAAGISFGYDNNGNTTTQSSRIYTYNQNQRLIQVVDGAMTANYTYNGNGQRVKKNVNGTITIFLYNQSGQIIAEANSSGTITAEYVYLNGQPLAKMEGSNTYYYHNDHLATPQKMTDSSGAIVWAADYKPFGEATITVSTITNNLRFPGQYSDADTALAYNYYRDYNPIIGRFVESDPNGILQGINHLFIYAGNNPLGRVDIWGLQASGQTGTCTPKPKSCAEQAEDAYNACVAGISKGAGNISTTGCIGNSVLFGFATGGAAVFFTKNIGAAAVGGTVGAIGTLYCLTNVGPNVAPNTGTGGCSMLKKRIFETCEAGKEP